MAIDHERLRSDIEANARHGAIETDTGRGRTVLTGSDADKHVRERFIDRLEDAGLDHRIDRVGNIVGRWVPEGASEETPPVALGSHLDSVPSGGIFDGPLGVYSALEAVRSIQESDETPSRPLEVVCFTEEEGSQFGIGTLGSRVMTGRMSVESALELTNDGGETLEQRLERIGFAGTGDIDPATWHAWFEVHVEQDTRLESAGVPIGTVDSISGITNCAVTVTGEANHAGATSMDERRDALVAAAEFVVDVERIAEEIAAEHPSAVATVGRHDVEPNVRNIVPGGVTMQMDIRATESDVIDTLVDRYADRLDRLERRRPVETSIDRYRDTPPIGLSERCIDAINRGADRQGVDSMDLYSAAIHDTANVSTVTDAGMLFAPSRDGISHSPQEWTEWEDCATSAGVLAAAALEVT
ncbi:Zn-dependent hydrolase [Natrarchaeobius halalkaliphilus]|uniref:Zn-dependent hydrolase n=1 Tax=Natrarchaeobius halalkaliphilus TaxID=1679091 RepID=A0A3N6LPA3_9EURY|nr:Zn-dependent hydrolase [Natrarchaeobius halalkaliphilus]